MASAEKAIIGNRTARTRAMRCARSRIDSHLAIEPGLSALSQAGRTPLGGAARRSDVGDRFARPRRRRREADDEAAAVTDAVAERLDAAVVQLDELAYDRQSQPEALGRPARRGALDERFEHVAEQLARHPGTAVVDAQHDLLALR